VLSFVQTSNLFFKAVANTASGDARDSIEVYAIDFQVLDDWPWHFPADALEPSGFLHFVELNLFWKT
jgi:hypothetical protein